MANRKTTMGKKRKYSIDDVKNISPKVLLKIIQRAKNFLKKDKTMKEVFAEYGETTDLIDYIPTMFGDIDVSGKTSHGVVILNYKLLADGDFFKDYSYLVHEYSHYAQQCLGEKPTKSSDKGDYLDNPYEQQGFQNQVEFIAEHHGKNEAEKYVDNLLDYHDVPHKEEKSKKEKLLAKI